MKFQAGSGLTPSHLDYLPEEHGWQPLARPNRIAAMLLSVVVALALFLGVSLAFYYFASVRLPKPPPFFLLAILIPLIPIHELLHALVHPGLGMSSRTYVGFYLPRGAFYAHYAGERTRARFIVGALTPFMLLSVLPLILCATLHLVLPTLAWASSLNAALSATDVMTALVLFFQCPRGAVVLTDQNKAWWRAQPAAA
jgi:hypothetical protein